MIILKTKTLDCITSLFSKDIMYVYTSPLKAVMIENNYVYVVKYITTYTNFYTTRSQMVGIA